MDRLQAAIHTIVCAEVAEDSKDGGAVSEKVTALLREFATTVRPAHEWAELDDSQMGEELRTLNLLNFNWTRAVERTGFEQPVRDCCVAILRKKYTPERATQIADFLVSRCDVDFLESCDDYMYDPEDFDDGVDYERLFFRVASYADIILAAGQAGDSRGESENELTAQERADTSTTSIDEALEAWEATDAETILKQINGSSSELAELMQVYRRRDKGQQQQKPGAGHRSEVRWQ